MAEQARLFVALEVPPDVREELVRWREPVLRHVDGLRSVAADALHVTLCFLGWREVEEIEPIGDACEMAVGGSPRPALALGEPVWLPRRRPRVLGVRVDDCEGALAAIQGAVSTALSAGGWYEPETRPFLAHVTLARAVGRANLKAVELPPPAAPAFVGQAVTLYRSRLERGGARYSALRTVFV